MGNQQTHGGSLGATGAPGGGVLPFQRARPRRAAAASSAPVAPLPSSASAPAGPRGPNPLHLALLQQSSMVSSAGSNNLPAAAPLLDAAAASVLDQFGNASNNNGIRPLAALGQGAPGSAAGVSNSLLRRSANPQVMLSLRDELFDKSAASLAAFLGLEPPSSPTVATFLALQPEPVTPRLFQDELSEDADAEESEGKRRHADLIRHLIRSIHTSVHSADPSLVATPSSRGPTTLFASNPTLMNSMQQSHASNEHDDQELAFRLTVIAQIYASHHEKMERARKEGRARMVACRANWHAGDQLAALQQRAEVTAQSSALDTTLRSFVAINLQLLHAVQQLGAAEVISSVLSTSVDCFLRVQPLSLCSPSPSASGASGFDMYQVFQPLFTFLTGVAVGRTTTDPTSSTQAVVAASPTSVSYCMLDRSKALGILFGAALASGNLEEILHVISLLYSHHLQEAALDDSATAAPGAHLGAQIGQFVPALIALQSSSSDASDESAPFDDDTEIAVSTPLFTHAHPLKMMSLVYSASWVCDSHHSQSRSQCHITGEGFVFHCEHNDAGGEGAIDDPIKQAAAESAQSCGDDYCTHCVRREKERQEKAKEIRAGFPALSPNGIIKAVTAGSASSMETPSSPDFSLLSTPDICAVILSQLDRLSLPYHPVSSPSLTFASPQSLHARPSNHSLMFDPVAATVSSYYLGTPFNSSVVVRPDLRKFREDPTVANVQKKDSPPTDEDVKDGVRRAGVATLQQPLKIHVSVRTLTLLSTILEAATTAFLHSFTAAATTSPLWLSHGLIISSCLRLLKAHLYQLHVSQLAFADVAAAANITTLAAQALLTKLQLQIERFSCAQTVQDGTPAKQQALDSLARESTEALLSGFRFFFPTAGAQMEFALTIFQSPSSAPTMHATSRTTLLTFLNLHFAHFHFGLELMDELAADDTANSQRTLETLKIFLSFLMRSVERDTTTALESLSLDPEVAAKARLPSRELVFLPELSDEDRLQQQRAPTPTPAPLTQAPPRRSSLALPGQPQQQQPSGLSRPTSLPRAVSFTPNATPRGSSLSLLPASIAVPLPPLARMLDDGATTASGALPSTSTSFLLSSDAAAALENIQQFLLCAVGRSLHLLLNSPRDSLATKSTSHADDGNREEKQSEEKENEDPSNGSLHLSPSDVAAPIARISQRCEDALLHYATLLAESSHRTLNSTVDFLHAQEAWMKSDSPAAPWPSVVSRRGTGNSHTTPQPSPRSVSTGGCHPSPRGPRHDSLRLQNMSFGGATVAEQRWDAWKTVCETVIRNCFVTTLGRPFLTALHLLLATPQLTAGSGPSVATLAQHSSVTSALALTLLPSLSTLISSTNSFHTAVGDVRSEREAEIEAEERFLRGMRAQTSRQRSSVTTIVQGNLAPPTVLLKTELDAPTPVAPASTIAPPPAMLEGFAAVSAFASAATAALGTERSASPEISAEDKERDLLDMYPQARMSFDRHSPSITIVAPLTLRRDGPLAGGAQAAAALSVQALLPLPHRETAVLYFEVSIDSLGEQSSIGVGFTPVHYSLHRMPGWDADSFALHGDDGGRFHHAGHGAPYGPLFKQGDVVGCAMNLDRGEVFWTLNGKHLGVAFTQVDTSLAYHAAIGMISPSEQVTINFGAEPFIYQYLPKIQNQQLDSRDLHQTFLTPRIVSEAAESLDRSHDSHALLRLPSECRYALVVCDHAGSTGALTEHVEVFSGLSKSGPRILRDHRTNWLDEQYPQRYMKSCVADRAYVYFSAQCGYRVTMMGIVMEPACGRWMRTSAHQLQALYAHAITNLLTSPSITWQTLLQPSTKLLRGLQTLLASQSVFKYDLKQQAAAMPSAWKHTIQAVHDAAAADTNASSSTTTSSTAALMTSNVSASSDALRQQHSEFLQDLFQQSGTAASLLRALHASVSSAQKQRLMKSVEPYAETVTRALFACMLYHAEEIDTAIDAAALFHAAATATPARVASPLLPPPLCHLFHLALNIRQHFAFLKGTGGASAIVDFTNTALRRIRFLLSLQAGAWKATYEQADHAEPAPATSPHCAPEEKAQTPTEDELADESKESSLPELARFSSGSSHTIKAIGRLKDLLQLRAQVSSPRTPFRSTQRVAHDRGNSIHSSTEFSSGVSRMLSDLSEMIRTPSERFSVADCHAFFLAQHSGAAHRILAFDQLVARLPQLSGPSLGLLLKWIGSCWAKDASAGKHASTAHSSALPITTVSPSHYSYGLACTPAHLSAHLTTAYFHFLSRCLSHPSLDLSMQLFLFDLFNFDFEARDLAELQRINFVQNWLGDAAIGFSAEAATRPSSRATAAEPPITTTIIPADSSSDAQLTSRSSLSATSSDASSSAATHRRSHLLLRSVSWALWRLIMYSTLDLADDHGNLPSSDGAAQSTSANGVAPSSAYPLHLFDQLYAHLRHLQSAHVTQSEYERTLAIEKLEAKRRAFLVEKQQKDAILECEKECEKEERRQKDAAEWHCGNCDNGVGFDLTQPACPACGLSNPHLIGSSHGHDRANCVYDFVSGGLPSDVADIDFLPGRGEALDRTTVVSVRTISEAVLIGPCTSFRWCFEGDATATAYVPANVGLSIDLPPPAAGMSSTLRDFSLILDVRVDYWPAAGQYLVLFAPTSATDLMSAPASDARQGLWLDHTGRLGLYGRAATSSHAILRVKAWHRIVVVRDSKAATLSILIDERIVDVQHDTAEMPMATLTQPSKASCLCLKTEAIDPASTHVMVPAPSFVSCVRLVQVKKYAMGSEEIALLSSIRSPGPSAPLPYDDHGPNTHATSLFDFCLEATSSHHKLPSGVSIHGKRKLEWRADNFRALPSPTGPAMLTPARYFHVSPGTYLFLSHTLDQHNTPPMVKLLQPPPSSSLSTSPALPTSSHFTVPHALTTYTLIVDMRMVSMSTHDQSAIFLLTRSPKKSSSSSSSAPSAPSAIASTKSSADTISLTRIPDTERSSSITTTQPLITDAFAPRLLAPVAVAAAPAAVLALGQLAQTVPAPAGFDGVAGVSPPPPPVTVLAASPPPTSSTSPVTFPSSSGSSAGSSSSNGGSSSSSSRDRLNHSLLINHNGHFCFPSSINAPMVLVNGKTGPHLLMNQWHRVVIVVEQGADLQPGVSAAVTADRGTEGGLHIYIDGVLHSECRGLAFLKHPGLALHNPFLIGDPFAAHASVTHSKSRSNWSFDLRNVQVKSYAMQADEIAGLPMSSPPFFCQLPAALNTLPALPAPMPHSFTGAQQLPCSLFFRPQTRTHLILHGPDVLKTLSQPGHFSVAMWVKVWRVTDVEQVLVSKPSSPNTSAWRVSLVQRHGVDTIVFGGVGKGTTAAQQAAFPFISTPLPARNRWLHIGITYDGSVYRLFVNGLVRKSGHSRTEFDGLGGPLVFGVLCSDSTHFFSHGAMADIAVWKTPLSVHDMYSVRLGRTAQICRSTMLCHIEFKEALSGSSPNVLLTNSVSHEWMHNHMKLMCVRGITYADVPPEVQTPIDNVAMLAAAAPILAAAAPLTDKVASNREAPALLLVGGSASSRPRSSSAAVSIDTSSIQLNATGMSVLTEDNALNSAPFLRVRQFQYESDMDENGLMFYLGCKSAPATGAAAGLDPSLLASDDDEDVDEGGEDESDDGGEVSKHAAEEEYKNPAERGHVTVTCSQYADAPDVAPITAVVGRTAERAMSATARLDGASPFHWFCVDLHARHFSPTHYTLRHYVTHDGGALRDWNFDGFDATSNTWVTLRQHVNDSALQTKGQTYTWDLPTANHQRFFSKFRVIMTSTVNSADYLCLSGFEMYGSLLLNSATPAATIAATDAALATVRQQEYSDWDRYASHLNLYECSMSWLLGSQQLQMVVEPSPSVAVSPAHSVYQVRKRAHSACVAEIHVAMLPWLWLLLRSLKMAPHIPVLLQRADTQMEDTTSAQGTLRSWITLLLQLAQPSAPLLTRSPTSQSDGGARLVRALSLRSLRVLLPLISPSTLLAWDHTNPTAEIPLSTLLTPVLQLIGTSACPKSILPLLREYSALRPATTPLISPIEELSSSNPLDTDRSFEMNPPTDDDEKLSLHDVSLMDDSTSSESLAHASFSSSRVASISFASFCANRLSFLPQEEMWEWLEMCMSLGQSHPAESKHPLFSAEWQRLLQSHVTASMADISSIMSERRAQLASEAHVPLPSTISASPALTPSLSSRSLSRHPAIDRTRFMRLIATFSLMGGALDVWREGGRVIIRKDAADQQPLRATLLSLVRVSALPHLLRGILDKNLPIDVNVSLLDGLYPSGGLLSDSGESLMVLPSQQVSLSSPLAWSQLTSLSAADLREDEWTLGSLFQLLRPLLDAPDRDGNEAESCEDDFVITVLRRYAFRVFARYCSVECQRFVQQPSLCTASAASLASILSSLAAWSTRPTHHFADAPSSIENLESRLRQMAVFEKEREDDRLFKVREKKLITQQTPRADGTASLTSAPELLSPSKTSAAALQSFSGSLSVHHGTCSGVGSGLGLDRSSNLQLINLPEHRKDKKKREKERTKESELDKCGREDIIFVASLWTHHVVLTGKGKVFHAISTPTSSSANPDRFVRLTFPDKTRIVQVAVGIAHTLILTAEGRVWMITSDSPKERPPTANFVPEPLLVDEEIGGQRVLLIGAGAAHSFALTHRGLYAFGHNHAGQLGLGHSRSVKAPTMLRADDVPVDSFVQIVGGFSHSLALTSKGVVYAWGALGLNDKGVSIATTTPTRFLLPTGGASDRVIQIVAAENHSLFLTDQGHVYAHSTGATAPGVLGNESATELNRVPKRIRGALSTQVVTMIATSRSMSAVLTQTNQVFIMGLEVNKGRPTSKDVVLTPTLLVQTSPSLPVIFITCGATHMLTLQSVKKQKRELSTSPLSVQLISSKVNTNLAPYPSLACIVGDDSKFYYADSAGAIAKRRTTIEINTEREAIEAALRADGPHQLAPAKFDNRVLLDMVTAADGLRGRHRMAVERSASAGEALRSHSPLDESAHVEGVRILPGQKLMAYMALNTSTVHLLPAHLHPFTPIVPSRVLTSAPSTPQRPAVSGLILPLVPATAASAAATDSLPAGFTVSLRVCHFDSDGESKLALAAADTLPVPSTLVIDATQSPQPSAQFSQSTSNAPLKLLSVQLPVGHSSDASESAPRALELCCDASLTHFSFALLNSERVHFDITHGPDSARASKPRANGEKAAVWHTVTVVCANVDTRLTVRIFVDGFCYLRCTDPRQWATRDCDMPITPAFMPNSNALAGTTCTLPITMLEGWNGRCSDAGVWLHALADSEVSHVHASGLFYLMNDLLEFRIYQESQQMHQLYINKRDAQGTANGTSALPSFANWSPNSNPNTPVAADTECTIFLPAEETIDATVQVRTQPAGDAEATSVPLDLSHFAPSACLRQHVDALPPQLLARSGTSAVGLAPVLTSPAIGGRSLTADKSDSFKGHLKSSNNGELVFHLPPRSSLVVQRRVCATESSLDQYTLVMDVLLLRRPVTPVCLFQASLESSSAMVHLQPDLTLTIFNEVMSPHKWSLGVWHRVKLSVNVATGGVLLLVDHFCVAGYKLDPASRDTRHAQLQQQLVIFADESPTAHDALGIEVRAIQLTRKASTLQQLLAYGMAHAPFPSIRNLAHATRSLSNQGFPARWASKAFVSCDAHRRAACRWLLRHASQLSQADEESQLTASVAGLSDVGVSVGKCKAALLRSQGRVGGAAAPSSGDARPTSAVDYEKAVSWLLFHADDESSSSWDLLDNGDPSRSPINLAPTYRASATSSSSSVSRTVSSGDNWRWKLDRAQLDRPVSAVNPTFALLEDVNEAPVAGAPNVATKRDDSQLPLRHHFLRLPVLAESERKASENEPPPLIIRQPVYRKWLKHRAAFLMQRLDAEENLGILYARRTLIELLASLPKDIAVRFVMARPEEQDANASPDAPTEALSVPTGRFLVPFLRLIHCSYFPVELLDRFAARIAEWMEDEAMAIEQLLAPSLVASSHSLSASSTSLEMPGVLPPLSFPALQTVAPLSCMLIEEVIFQLVIAIQRAHDDTTQVTMDSTTTAEGSDKSKTAASATATSSAVVAAAAATTAAAAHTPEGEQSILAGAKSSTSLLLWLLGIFNGIRLKALPVADSALSLATSSLGRRLYLLSKHLFCPQVMNLLFEGVVVCLADTRITLLTLLSSVVESMEEETPQGIVVTLASAVAIMPDFSSPSTMPHAPPALSCPSFSYPFLASKPWLLKHVMLRLYQAHESKSVVWSVALQTIIELNIKLENAECARQRFIARRCADGKLRRKSTARAIASPQLAAIRMAHRSTASLEEKADDPPSDVEEELEEEDVASSLLRSLTLAGTDFQYQSDFDRNGIVYHLGCDGGDPHQSWVNPATTSPPTIKVTSSGRHTTYSEVLHLSRTPVVALTSASQGSWLCFDFLDRAVLPTHYTMRHYTQASYALRNWVFEGTVDGEEWVVLRTHTNDMSLAARDATRTWSIDLTSHLATSQGLMEPFRKLRVRMTGPNSSNSWHLVCSGWEVYGKLVDYGALHSRNPDAGSAGTGSDLTCPPNPVWFHKVMLSQQYMLAFQPVRGVGVRALGSSESPSSSFDMFRIPLEFARAIWTEFQVATTEYTDKKGVNFALGRPARQSSVASLSPHLLSPTRAAAVYTHTPYGYAAAQHAVDGFFHDSAFTQSCTLAEDVPWLEIDLGNAQSVGEIVVFSKHKAEATEVVPPVEDLHDSLPEGLPLIPPPDVKPTPLVVNPNADPNVPPPVSFSLLSLLSPRLMRQTSIIAASLPRYEAEARPSYLVLMSESPFAARPPHMPGAEFVEFLKTGACFVGQLLPISTPSHPLEETPGVLHLHTNRSSASAISPSAAPRARFVRVLYTGVGELRLNQVAVFPPVATSLSSEPYKSPVNTKATAAATVSDSSANPTASPVSSPHAAAATANTDPSMLQLGAPLPQQLQSQANFQRAFGTTRSVTNLIAPANITSAMVSAHTSSSGPSLSSVAAAAAAAAIRRKEQTSFSTSGVSSSTVATDPITLVPFYICASLFNSGVSLELLTYLHRLCEKRGINILELNILADQPLPEKDPPSLNNGVSLPFTPTELLQYPDLARLGTAVYDNAHLIKLCLLILQHFNKVIMSMLPLIDFSVHQKRDTLTRGSSEPLSPSLHLADSIRNIRHFLLWSSKRNVWEQSLAATVATVPKPNIDVDLVAASPVSWSKKVDRHARRTVFGQLFSQRSKLPSVHFRLTRSARAFTVNYVGMRATDAGGPYRQVNETMGNELQSALLPLFIKVPNAVFEGAAANNGVDLFVPRPSSNSPQHLLMYEFVGKLIGLAIRTKNLWNLNWPSLIWKRLLGVRDEEITDADIRSIDSLASTQLERMTAILQAMDQDASQAPAATDASSSSSSASAVASPSSSSASAPLAIDDATLTRILSPSIKFTLVDSENRVQTLIPNGADVSVTHRNFGEYVRLTRAYRYHEFDVQCAAMRRGLSSVIPPSVLLLLTCRELENAVCGRGLGVEDIALLEKMTKYSGCARADRHIDLFWRMLRERLTDEQRAQFLIFVYGRSRLPSSSADVDTSFTIMRAPTRPLPPSVVANSPAHLALLDRQLPTSHTCGFALELPPYSSVDVMTERLLYAIAHCTEVDADGGNARIGHFRIQEEEEEE